MAGKKGLPARIEKHGSSLIIEKVALSDAGQYFCHGYNVFSSLTAYVNVSVYGKYVTDIWLTKYFKTVVHLGEIRATEVSYAHPDMVTATSLPCIGQATKLPTKHT